MGFQDLPRGRPTPSTSTHLKIIFTNEARLELRDISYEFASVNVANQFPRATQPGTPQNYAYIKGAWDLACASSTTRREWRPLFLRSTQERMFRSTRLNGISIKIAAFTGGYLIDLNLTSHEAEIEAYMD